MLFADWYFPVLVVAKEPEARCLVILVVRYVEVVGASGKDLGSRCLGGGHILLLTL